MPSPVKFEPLRASDLDDFFGIWGDPEALKTTIWKPSPTREKCAIRLKEVLAHYASDPRRFGPYVIRVDKRFVGLIGADFTDSAGLEYDVWYIVARSERGNGIGSHALAELIRVLNASGRVRRISANTLTENRGSCRVLEKNNFIREAVVLGTYDEDGSIADVCRYVFLPSSL